MPTVNPADYQDHLTGQAVANAMNGAFSLPGLAVNVPTIAEVESMLTLAKNLSSETTFVSQMNNNMAWTMVNGTFKVSFAELKEFATRFDVQQVFAGDRGLNGLRTIDASTGEQWVFLGSAGFPGEFFGGGVGQTGRYGGDVVQGKALVDQFQAWADQDIDMNGAFVSTSSLGGSILSMAIPNLNVTLGGVVAYGAYGTDSVAMNQSTQSMVTKYGMPDGFNNDFATFDAFMTNARNAGDFGGLSIINLVNVGDWVPTAATIDRTFGTRVYLTTSNPIQSGAWYMPDALHNLSIQHVLPAYKASITLPENNPSQGGINYSVVQVGTETRYTYSNGATYTEDVIFGTRVWTAPTQNNTTITWRTDVHTGVTTVTESPTSAPNTVLGGYEVSAIGDTRVALTQFGANKQPIQSQTVQFDDVPDHPTWRLLSAIDNGTGQTSAQLIDFTGAPVLVASAGESLVRDPNTGVFTVTRANGAKEYLDPTTGARIFQATDGSGTLFTGPEDNRVQTNFSAGGLTINSEGSFTVTPAGGQPPIQLFQTSNSINVSTNTDLSTTQPGSSDPQNVSPIEQGTAFGNPFGSYWVGLDPFTLNFDEDIMSSVMGDTATGGYRPGNFNLSPVDDLFDDIDYWYDYQSDAMSLMLEQQIGNSYLRQASSYLLDAGYQVTWWPADPLVLDLNGDGVQLASFHDHPVSFDIDHDGGSKEDTGWVAANTIKTGTLPAINTDGIVAYDLNNNGVIDDISETLSEYFNGAVGTNGNQGTKPFTDGFAALRSLDSNNDGVFDSNDAAWENVRVWVDDNADGVSFKDVNGNGTYQVGIDTSELKTFAELGITRINLDTTSQSGLVNGGNEVLATGSFVMGGETREAQAARFLANPNGHTFLDQQNGTHSGTKILTDGEQASAAYVSYSTTGEAMDAAALGVRNLYGGAGNDTLTGDANDNWLSGSLGSDTFNAGAGDDVLLIDASDLQANIHAGSGTDLAMIVGDAGVTLNLGQAEVEVAQGGRGDDILIGGGRSSVFIRGGDGDDIVIGGAANDALSGEDGNDLIDGGMSNDLIRGQRGRDTLYGGAGDDILDSGMEDDAVSGGTGNDVLKGGQGDDMLDGGDGVDLAEFAGGFADYRIAKIDATTYRVVDTKAGRDGADTVKNIEKISFADVSAVDITLDNPLPVKDVITIADRNGAKLISVAQLLANDVDWQGDALHITTISDVKGGTIAGTVGGNGEITPTIDANGELTFTPDPSFTGVMGFKYKIADVDGTPGATALQAGTTNAAEMRGQVFIKTPDMPTDPVFTDQWYLTDINVIPVWKDYTGKGVRIGQFEPSGPYAVTKEILDYRHADLQPNIDLNFISDKNNVPGEDFSEHATLVAGVTVAARNGDGAVGVAYNAKIAGWQIGDTITVNSPTSVTADFANLYKLQDYDVSNNSWGFAGAFENFATATPPVAEEFFKPAVLLGRGGLGANIVMAGGNSRQTGGNTNYSDTTNNRFVITTGAINAQGDISTLSISQTPFSNPGASILISAPGSNVATTSRILMNDQGTVFGTDTANVEGTSFATPIISGVVALMLEANPNLGWRDVQQILALSGRNVNDASTDWTYNAATNWNGGGMHASHDYGFGDVDARAAVRLAETWTGAHTSYNERHLSQAEGSLATGGSNLGVAIPDGAVITRNLSIGAGIRAEHVDITVDLNHSNWGDLKVDLISPSGTVSKLVTNPETTASNPGGTVGIGQLKYTFDTTHSYGELAQGNWQLRITDRSGRGVGTLNGWKVDVYGSDSDETINSRDLTPGEAPVISATGNNTYFYTDEFATAPGSSRATLTDANGGTDIINAAAVSTGSTINLDNGSTSTIAGRNLTINGNVEFAFGGDGNDTLTGNAVSNRLQGGRGNDTLNGGDSLDLLDGGRGNDTLTGGAGIDYFVIRKETGAVDTITDFSPGTVAEKILFVGFDSVTDFTQVTVTQEGVNTRLNLGDGQSVLLQNIAPSQITEQNFGFFSDDAMLEKFANYMSNVSVFAGTSGIENGLLPDNMGDMRYFALGGDDVIGARTTNDLVDGGDGNDTIWGDYPGFTVNPGADWLEGGAGNDTLVGGTGDDLLLGGSGSDNLQGEASNDVLRGASGADQITGGDGNDLLLGGAGDDYLDGGNGDDVIFLEGDFGTVDGTNFGFFGTRVGGAGADVLKVTPNGGGNGGFSASGTQFSAFNLVADFNPSQAGEMIDLSALTWVRGFGDLGISNLTINGVTFARVSATSGTQQLMINLRGVTSSQLNATHFKFTTTPGLVFGGTGNDTLTGDAGGNTIDGGAGADNMTGRTGDDTFIVDNLGDVVNELPGGGFDTVQSGVTYTLPADVENLVLTGATATNGTGNANSNRITGNSGNNVLDGHGGADTLIGGAGNDTYIVDDQADTILENLGEGTDSVESSVSFTLGNNIENLTLTGTDRSNATGNAFNNVLTGNATDNILDGAGGADTMAGGAGDDTYYVDNAGDIVTENVDEGIDAVYSAVNYTLGANVESLALYGSAVTGTGNALDNILSGNALNNTLNGGGGGNDFLDGGAGADTLTGGTGDDFYVVDNAGDVVTENAAEGADLVQSSISYTLGANLENLTLTGALAINGTGNALDNRVTGNSTANTLTGLAGNDILEGGGGNDTLDGGAGFDTAVFAGQRASYVVTVTGPRAATVTLGSVQDTLIGMERIRFDDGEIALAGPSLASAVDFNSDGKSDILWRNRSTGEDYIYHMDGTAISSEGYIQTVLTDWNVVGLGDFDADAHADVLWRNSQSGENYIYFMNGLSVQSGGYIRTVPDMNWGVMGTGDFNGDFKSDVLWRNSQSGENYIYCMNGLSIQSEGYVRTVTDMNWGIAGTGDFDGDGKSDVLWRNAQSGENYIYFMNGVSLHSEGYIRTVPDINWAVAGTGDFNGDGKSDLLWRNGATGQNYLYLMNGLEISGEGYVRDVPDLDWAIFGTGDYNGDAKSDIVWRNSSTGENYLYPMDGLTILPTQGYLRQVPDQSWQPVNGSEVHFIGDSLRNWLIGTGAGDLLEGRGGDDSLNGRGGNDVLSGGGGTDQLADTSGQNLLWGGAGNDTLAAGAGRDFLAGGTGDDVIQTGAGQNVISFNAGDGTDMVSSQAGATNALSFGGGVRYGDLSLSKSGNDLVVNAGGNDSVTLKDWYAGRDDVATLQVMIDASSDYNSGSADAMYNEKVQTFDFRGLVSAFDAALAASPGLTSWALTNALLQWHLSHSDDEALGGDLAYWYSKNSTLTGVGLLAAQQVIGAAGFGSDAQTLRPFSGLQEGLVKLT